MAAATYEPEWVRLPSEMILSEAIRSMAEEGRHWACVYDQALQFIYFVDILDIAKLLVEHPEYRSLSLRTVIEQSLLPLHPYPLGIDEKELILNKLKEARAEAEAALASLLPDRRLEARLKEIVEYTDALDPESGKVIITGRIEEGVYQHVLNILRLLAEVMRQGLMELPGLERDTLVQVAIFHDIGKVQPDLQVGEIVDPCEVFEDGKLHAARGAEIVAGFYKVSDNVIQLIRYHHHEENELPASFPAYLLPMYRLFRLIDSLSAGITRHSVQVKLNVKGTKVTANEYTVVPEYNRQMVLDLYTGEAKKFVFSLENMEKNEQ